ncbi:MAG: type II secretion system protein M [Zoogloeaceae bacterium]|jgi:MSHA biogenesis protein MshJ|nr:type II secretion system protein M [Zoogloeaceae bacterium]
MSNLKTFWQNGQARFAALNPRERVLVVAAVLGGIVYLGAILWIEPTWRRTQQYKTQAEEQAGVVANLQAQVEGLRQMIAADPNDALRADIRSVENETDYIEQQIAPYLQAMVAPDAMRKLLKDVIRKSGVRLVGFNVRPPEGFLAARRAAEKKGKKNGGESPVANDIYKHAIEIQLLGGYPALTGYLKTLEALPQGLYWQSAKLGVLQYPDALLTLVVYTLSLNKEWLEL